MKITLDTPLNPECPVATAFRDLLRDRAYVKRGGYWEKELEDFEKTHKRKCEKCRKYGVGGMKGVNGYRRKQGCVFDLPKS